MSTSRETGTPRHYAYVGPQRIADEARGSPAGSPIRSVADLLAWLGDASHHEADDPGWGTYVVTLEGTLRLAHRRSEHVACAEGQAVLAAGEIALSHHGEVTFLSNNSSGYCPDLGCFEAVAAALCRAGLHAPAAFTVAVPFRRCGACGARCTVKDNFYFCDLCDGPLERVWNF